MNRKSRLPVRSNSNLDSNTLGLPGQRKSSLRRNALSCERTRRNALSCERSAKRTPNSLRPDPTAPIASGSQSRSRRFKSPTNLDARSVQDAKWLKSQVKKIAEFMISVDDFPNMVYTNPTTIQTFVCVVSTLLNQLEPRFKLDANNYKTKVPEYLAMFGYPGKCTPNLMKTVYAQYSYPNVVQIWSFLLEQVTRKQLRESPKDHFLLKFTEMGRHCEAIIKHSQEAFYLFQKENCYDRALKNYKEEFDCLYETNYIDLEIEKNSNSYNEARAVTAEKDKEYKELLAKLEVTNANIMDKQEKMDSFKSGVKNSEKTHIAQIQTLQLALEKSESANENKEAVLSKLESKIAEIGHTPEEVQELSREVNAKEHTQKLRAERKIHYMEQITQFDSKITELKNEVETLVFSINNSLHKCICVFKHARDYFVPESGFDTPYYLETIKTKRNRNNLVETLSKFEKNLEEQNLHVINMIGVLNESHAEKKMQLQILKGEYEDTVSQKLVINENYKKLHAEKLVVQSIETDLQKLQGERIDLSKYEKLREKAEERYTYLQILQSSRRSDILNFFQRVHRMFITTNSQIWKLMHNGCKQQQQKDNEINDYISKATIALEQLEAHLKFEET